MRYLLNQMGVDMINLPEVERISNDVIYLHLKRRVEQTVEVDPISWTGLVQN